MDIGDLGMPDGNVRSGFKFDFIFHNLENDIGNEIRALLTLGILISEKTGTHLRIHPSWANRNTFEWNIEVFFGNGLSQGQNTEFGR